MIAEQISIFDILAEMTTAPAVAVSMFDNQEHELHEVEPWMSRILPDGEYYITLGGMYTMVLSAVRKAVPKELHFCHYKINDKVYSATGVGIDKGADDDLDEDDSCECE